MPCIFCSEFNAELKRDFLSRISVLFPAHFLTFEPDVLSVLNQKIDVYIIYRCPSFRVNVNQNIGGRNMKIYKSVEQLVGKTPLLELTNIKKELGLKADIIAKLEFLNPAGSVKDRVAKKMLEDAEASGKINKNSVIIEPTSGNTGIGLA